MDRIVINKCHIVLDSQPDFQLKIRKMGGLIIDRGVQMIYLTATLLLADKAEFIEIVKV